MMHGQRNVKRCHCVVIDLYQRHLWL